MTKKLKIIGLLPTITKTPMRHEGNAESLLSSVLGQHGETSTAMVMPRLLGWLEDESLVQVHLTPDGKMQAFSIDSGEEAAIKNAVPVEVNVDNGAGSPVTGALLNAATHVARGSTIGASPEDEPSPSDTHARNASADAEGINFPLSAFSQAMLGQGLASVIASGDGRGIYAGLRDVSGLTGFLAGQLLSKLTGNLMQGWKLDDHSSTAEFAARAAADRTLAELQSLAVSALLKQGAVGASPSLAEQLGQFFGPVTSNATLQIATDGDPDDRQNLVAVSEARQVIANGAEVVCALSKDKLVPAGKPIMLGSKSVRVGQDCLMLAHESSATAVPSTLSSGLHNVLVAPDPPDMRAAELALPQLEGASGSPDKATKECERIDKAAAAAGQIADMRKMNAEERERFIQRAIDRSALAEPPDPRLASALNGIAYRTGEKGLLGPALHPLKPGERCYYNPRTGVAFTDSSLEGLDEGAKQAILAGTEQFVVLEVNTQVANYWTNPATGEQELVVPGNPELPSGYRSVLFQSTTTGQRYGVYGGTDDGVDWMHNLAQGLGFRFDGFGALGSSQYGQAKDDAYRWFEADAGTVLIGHSLGGGLAAYGAAMTGASATIFNPAGLGATSLNNVKAEGQPISAGQFQVYMVNNDLLSKYSTWVGQPPPFGDLHIIENTTGALPLYAHSNETISTSLWSDDASVTYLGYVAPFP